mmetsp:Transcript_11438/g.36209  ORF Transcript_11438/g.36209 Transcript_11438/m.36209 type:complete len:265 (+) Transcript_11438:367-1161(+)
MRQDLLCAVCECTELSREGFVCDGSAGPRTVLSALGPKQDPLDLPIVPVLHQASDVRVLNAPEEDQALHKSDRRAQQRDQHDPTASFLQCHVELNKLRQVMLTEAVWANVVFRNYPRPRHRQRLAPTVVIQNTAHVRGAALDISRLTFVRLIKIGPTKCWRHSLECALDGHTASFPNVQKENDAAFELLHMIDRVEGLHATIHSLSCVFARGLERLLHSPSPCIRQAASTRQGCDVEEEDEGKGDADRGAPNEVAHAHHSQPRD